MSLSTIPLDARLKNLRNQTVNYYDINKYVGTEARKNLDLFYKIKNDIGENL